MSRGDSTRAAVSRLVDAPVSALMVGSGQAGVTLAASLQSLLRGIRHANERLALERDRSRSSRTGPETPLVARVTRLDIVELYEDLAIEAVHVLRELVRSAEFSDAFALEDLLQRGAGGRRRVRFDQAGDWWQRLRITQDAAGTLNIETLTELARVQGSVQPTQRRVVDALLERAQGSVERDATLGQTLFELLVPGDVKEYAPGRRNLALVLEPAAAALTWELLEDRDDPDACPLSVETGMIRQLRIAPSRERVMRAPELTALVVGNPPVTDDRFPPLPGAAREGEIVATRLRAGGYAVTSLIGVEADPLAVLGALHAKPWRLLHLAGHGVFEAVLEPSSAPVTGLVLDGGVLLTAAEIDQMRVVPDLVFLSCCDLGQTRTDAAPIVAYPRLAANLGTQFIRMGTRAVVAAGWAVDDRAARHFARRFYDALFEGRPFGDAVKAARASTYDDFGQTNTWGAFQCYGDPAYSIATGAWSPPPVRPAASCEMVVALVALAARAEVAHDASRSALVTELNDLVREVPSQWNDEPDVCAALGRAFASVKDYEHAVAQYERALAARRTPEESATLSVVDALIDVREAWATALSSTGGRAAKQQAAGVRARGAELREHLSALTRRSSSRMRRAARSARRARRA
jgi:hypothetical protein